VCLTTCASQYPTGKQLYEDYAYCVLCVACYVDCNGLAAGCP
jgi:succinate dehydrogenase/fumarate reductase-like Fe-S protein